MTPVTVASGDKNAYYSSGNVGWSAPSVFAYRAIACVSLSAGGTIWGRPAPSSEQLAQSFVTPANAGRIIAFRMVVTKSGTPTDDFNLELHTNATDRPSGTSLDSTSSVTPAQLSASQVWKEFWFSTPVTVSASTKYWIVSKRSGSLDGTNYYSFGTATSNPYAAGGRSSYVSGAWSAEDATNDLLFQVLYEEPQALYYVTQDTSLHVWRSVDVGQTWSEQDAANAPSVHDANFPFSASDTITGPYITTARFTGANTLEARVFNMETNLWNASGYGTSPPTTASSDRNIRVKTANTTPSSNNPGPVYLYYSDSADDADIAYQRATGPSNAYNAKVLVLSGTSAERSTVSDVVFDRELVGFSHAYYYDAINDDFSHRSLTSTTQGTQIDVDSTAASTDTKHASAVYQTYLASGVTTVIAAYIDSDDTIQERILSLDVTSASVTMATEYNVGSATTTAGRQLSTCRYDGSNYIFAGVSGTDIVYYESTVAGTWSGPTTHLTGGTNIALSGAIAIEGYGLGIAYTDNGNAMFDWIITPSVPVNATATLTNASLTLVGQTVTATGQRHETATLTNASMSLVGQSVVVEVFGDATATLTNATLSLVGQSFTATAQRHETATLTNASLSLVGQSLAASAGTTAVLTNASLSLVAQSMTATGQRNETATLTNASLSLAGQSVSASAGATAIIANATLSLVGQPVAASAGALAIIANAVLTLNQQTVTAGAGVTAFIDTAMLSLVGQTIETAAQRNETATLDTAILTLLGSSVFAGVEGDSYPWDNGVVVTIGNTRDPRSVTIAFGGPDSLTQSGSSGPRSTTSPSGGPRSKTRRVGQKPRTTND